MCERMNTMMLAQVVRTERGMLVVCDLETRQEVVVRSNRAHCFCSGDCVAIHFSGAMTMSRPPQITAICIWKHPRPGC